MELLPFDADLYILCRKAGISKVVLRITTPDHENAGNSTRVELQLLCQQDGFEQEFQGQLAVEQAIYKWASHNYRYSLQPGVRAGVLVAYDIAQETQSIQDWQELPRRFYGPKVASKLQLTSLPIERVLGGAVPLPAALYNAAIAADIARIELNLTNNTDVPTVIRLIQVKDEIGTEITKPELEEKIEDWATRAYPMGIMVAAHFSPHDGNAGPHGQDVVYDLQRKYASSTVWETVVQRKPEVFRQLEIEG
jgi:hypothetical protein